MGQRLAKRVLLIGWDAADWKIINPLLDAGKMPALEFLINRGVMGNMGTLRPILSPMLWTSIATGKYPDKHGIWGFTEPDPHSGGVRLVSSTSRKVKAIWNILTQQGFKTHQVGWFASHPAEPINGISVSDVFDVATAPIDQPWPMAAGTVHPEGLAETFGKLRMHPGQVTADMVLPFIPRLREIDQEKDRRPQMVAKNLAETASVHNAVTWILENREWDFLAAFYIGIDHFSHGFANFHPPKMEGIPEDKFELYREVLEGAYRFHDMLLARLLELAGPETTFLLLSDHGFHSDHLRPTAIPKEPAGPTVQHRPTGIVAMMGPGVRQDQRIYGAKLLDITPTILTLFGLPVGEDMDGKVLRQAFDDPPEVEKIPSWEQVPGECGMHPEDMRVDAETSKAVLDQFVALGYIEAPNENKQKAVASSLREQRYNLGRAYLYSRRPGQAIPLLKEIAEANPEEKRYALHLALCYSQCGRHKEAQAVLDGLASAREDQQAMADWLRGEFHFAENDPEAALAALEQAEKLEPMLPDLHIRIGQTYFRRRRIAEAERAFAKALAADPDSPFAHMWMARVRLQQKRNVEAAEEALAAVGLEHDLPVGHFCLGIALARLRHFKRAIQAFETALALAPGFELAHRWLLRLHSLPRGDRDRARQHAAWLAQYGKLDQPAKDGRKLARAQAS